MNSSQTRKKLNIIYVWYADGVPFVSVFYSEKSRTLSLLYASYFENNPET